MNYFRLDHIAGLEPLVNLRVLMLGKNRIRKVGELKHFNDIKMITTRITTIAINKVEGLNHCPKLSVLDLHGNRYG